MRVVVAQERDRRVAELMVRFADTLVSDYDLPLLLADLCDACVEVFDAASSTVMVATDPSADELDVVAASDPADKRLGQVEHDAGEGPAIDAFRQREAVTEADLRSAGKRRWPEFSEAGHELDHSAVLAVPLRLRDRRIGALEVFWNEPRPTPEQDRALCQSLADIATIGILHARTVEDLATLTRQLQTALDSRIIIEQAKGVLVGRHGGTFHEVFEAMRREARSRNMPLAELARRIVEGG